MKKIVYVTGCLGFIGSYVTETLLNEGWYVMGVDKCTYAADIKLIKSFMSKYPNFSFMKEDINDLKFLYECDYVINCAAETHVGNSITNSDDFVHSNIGGVHHLLELIRNYRQESGKVPTLLHFSTDEVYGDIAVGAHTELDILHPSNPYSATKAAGDMLITAYARTYGIPYVIVRPTNNYGCGQYVEKLIPKACKYLMLDKPIPLHNMGKPVRNWLHAQDTADAVLLIVEKGVVNEIYNICGGFEQSNLETVTKIIKLVKGTDQWEPYVNFGVVRAGQDVRYALDDSKLRALGWSPKVKFDEELWNITEYNKDTFVW